MTDAQLREQLDILAQAGTGEDRITAVITDHLTGLGLDSDLAARLATELAFTGTEQSYYWNAVDMVTDRHHNALSAAVVAVRLARLPHTADERALLVGVGA